MQVVGHDWLGRPVVSVPGGLEKQDLEEVLRHRYLGIFGDEPDRHFLGGSDEITFGGNGDRVAECWRRTTARSHPEITRLWQDAYREIGRISSWLELPSYIRDEITRIYANLRAQGTTVKAGISLGKQLAKITWLACLIHRLPRTKAEITSRLKELYGYGIGRIPKEFVKAANYKKIRFRVKEEKGGRTYLRTYEMSNGKGINERVLARL
jgi:hypothetical protein